MKNVDARQRRATKVRAKIKRFGVEDGMARLSIHRSTTHIYAQIIAPVGGAILAQASSLELRGKAKLEGGKVGAAKEIGRLIAERAKAAKVEKVACDRSGFKYHGRVAGLVEAAREAGLVV